MSRCLSFFTYNFYGVQMKHLRITAVEFNLQPSSYVALIHGFISCTKSQLVEIGLVLIKPPMTKTKCFLNKMCLSF